MTVEIKKDDTPEEIRRKLEELEDVDRKARVERLKPFFGILKRKIDPLQLQKKWRNEWD